MKIIFGVSMIKYDGILTSLRIQRLLGALLMG